MSKYLNQLNTGKCLISLRHIHLPALLLVTLLTSLPLISCDNEDKTELSSISEPSGNKGEIIPVPDPVPIINHIKSTEGKPELSPIVIVGLPGSVPGNGLVHIINAELSHQNQVAPSSNGSFVAFIEARAGDSLAITYNNSLPIQYVVPLKGGSGKKEPPPPGPIPDVPPIVRISAEQVVIEGNTMAPAGVEVEQVIAINETIGHLAVALVNQDTHNFRIEIAANPGDNLAIYRDFSVLTNPWGLIAP